MMIKTMRLILWKVRWLKVWGLFRGQSWACTHPPRHSEQHVTLVPSLSLLIASFSVISRPLKILQLSGFRNTCLSCQSWQERLLNCPQEQTPSSQQPISHVSLPALYREDEAWQTCQQSHSWQVMEEDSISGLSCSKSCHLCYTQ